MLKLLLLAKAWGREDEEFGSTPVSSVAWWEKAKRTDEMPWLQGLMTQAWEKAGELNFKVSLEYNVRSRLAWAA